MHICVHSSHGCTLLMWIQPTWPALMVPNMQGHWTTLQPGQRLQAAFSKIRQHYRTAWAVTVAHPVLCLGLPSCTFAVLCALTVWSVILVRLP